MRIELIALDLDDTLLGPALDISPRNQKACRAAADAGLRIVLASGRNIHSMGRYAGELGIDREGEYLVCSNGAEIVELGSGKTLRSTRIEAGLGAGIASVVEALGLDWQVYEEGKILASRGNDWTERDSLLTGQPNEVIRDKAAVLSRPHLKFVIPGPPESLARALPALSSRFEGKVRFLISKPYFMEALPADADKGLALAWLCGRLGIDGRSVMAIGDAMNDLGMVSWAGLGCAPADAIPAVRAAAKAVSPFRHDEDAVADLIERLVLGG